MEMVRHRFGLSRLRLYLAVTLLSLTPQWVRSASVELDYSTWSFGQLYNIYSHLLSPPSQVTSELRADLVTSWHQVAFDLWLVSRGKSAGDFRYQRHLVRKLLHGYARDEARLDDPMKLYAHFVDGRMPPGSLVSPLRGFDRKDVTQDLYKGLVSGFKDSFPDSTNLFPILPVVRVEDPNTEDKVVLNSWGNLVSGKKWSLVSMEGFKSVPDRSPVDFFEAMSGPQRLYYIPAFMLASERNGDSWGGLNLSRRLLGVLLEPTDANQHLVRSANQSQLRAIASFFNDLLGPNDPGVERLKRLFGIGGEK